MARIASPRATWGVLDGNPVHDPIRAIAARAGVDFALDVALDDENRIAAVFSGSLEAEHRVACAHVRETAMVGVAEPYDVVVTTNSGYPLDQNLYQCVKGLKAAAGIVRDGGTIILAAACEDGLPSHGRYADLLASSPGPAEFLDALARGEISERDQWQVQVQAGIQARARVLAHTPGLGPRGAPAGVARAGGRRGGGAAGRPRGGRSGCAGGDPARRAPRRSRM